MMLQKEIFNQIVCENFDITDNLTRKALIGISEEDQAAIVSNLTSKLYDSIVGKVPEIDFGSIPESGGDITKVENYDKLVDCITTMISLADAYKQDIQPIVIIKDAVSNLASRRDMFEKAFRYEIELPMVMYNTLTLACYAATSYMISTCVEFVKNPNDESFTISMSKTGAIHTDQDIMLKNLDRFNKSCSNGEFDKCMDHIISSKIKNLVGGVPTGVAILAIAAIAAILLSVIPIMRELIFMFYLSRVRLSDYFEVQADLLEMNAANVEMNTTLDPKKRKQIAKRQANIASAFRKISNTVEIKVKESESKAVKEIGSSNKKLKIKDVTDKMPDSAAAALF